MRPARFSRPLSRERLVELDFALGEAIARRDGMAARQNVLLLAQELRGGTGLSRDEGAGAVREVVDRLQGRMEEAKAARDALGAEIAQLQVQRRVSGIPAAPAGRLGERSYRA